ncbi:MAG: hypothetical protein WDN06_04890 [Asticcacaulis sp.]
MAHKATLPHPAYVQPARPLTAAEKLFWRRFLMVLAVVIVIAGLVVIAPAAIAAAGSFGLFNSWDSPIDYD